MKYNTKEIEEQIVNYLYKSRELSPQSLTKVRLGIGLSDSKGDMRTIKECLDSLIKKGLIRKQIDRGNYKIEEKGITYIEEQ